MTPQTPKDESLSNKIFPYASFTHQGAIKTEDVKEAVKKLKKELETDLTGCFSSQKQCDEWNEDTNRIIDKIFGDELT